MQNRTIQTISVRNFAVIGAVSLLTGCAVESYKPVINGFSASTTKASTAFLEMRDAMVDADVKDKKTKILAGELRLSIPEDDHKLSSTRVRLQVHPRDTASAPAAPKPFVVEFPYLNELMQDITNYGANLEAVLNADTTTKVAASLTATGGSLRVRPKSLNVNSVIYGSSAVSTRI